MSFPVVLHSIVEMTLENNVVEVTLHSFNKKANAPEDCFNAVIIMLRTLFCVISFKQKNHFHEKGRQIDFPNYIGHTTSSPVLPLIYSFPAVHISL